MARLRRKDLKRDRFVEEVTHQVTFVAAHRKQFIAGGLAIVIVLVASVGYWSYARQRNQASRAALQEAVESYHGIVGEESVPGAKKFSSEAERLDSVTAALDKVTLDYSGTAAAAGALYYAGLLDREEDNTAEARSHFEQATRGKGTEYPSLARLALAELLFAEGEVAGAREQLQSLVENPTRTISRDRASIELARTYLETDPQKAREMLDAIQAENGPASPLAAALLETLSEGI
ncbi:MAG: tetratricopeptide repeat protein [Bryobacterales bacterium]|nr:tetratricopeptide repeat protein [Bryobacterales bacterium]